jgi:hypothetical protein
MENNNSVFCCVFSKPVYQPTTLFHEMESRKRSRNSDTGLYQRPCEKRSRVAGDLHLACERDQRNNDVAIEMRRSTSKFEGTGFFAKRLQVRPSNPQLISHTGTQRSKTSACEFQYSTFANLEPSRHEPPILLHSTPLYTNAGPPADAIA